MGAAWGVLSVDPNSVWKRAEFVLVFVMLVVLAVLVGLVLYAPISADATAADVIDYRKSLLAVIITAFGAWVGAGAAYYFGRENLREATQGMLSMRAESPKERLQHTTVREAPLRNLDWTVKTDDVVKDAYEKFRNEAERWFVPVLDANGKLVTVLDEEAIYNFVNLNVEKLGTDKVSDAVAKVKAMTIQDVIDFVGKDAKLKEFKDVAVTVTMDTTVGAASEAMDARKLFLAIVEDDKGMPTAYLTTHDVRKVLLRMQ